MAKEQQVLIGKKPTLHVHQAFFLHVFAFDARLQSETFYSQAFEDVNTIRQQFSFPEIRYSPLEFNSRKIRHYLPS